ncbi:hypothetical protein ACIOUG_22570 [Pseudomonas sp. NPDC087803]|uniref:hypothetical protein n=1 Tax=Pseudomonas sp. NPDC087803 TaxID=3364448 RepID=UPI00382585C6
MGLIFVEYPVRSAQEKRAFKNMCIEGLLGLKGAEDLEGLKMSGEFDESDINDEEIWDAEEVLKDLEGLQGLQRVKELEKLKMCGMYYSLLKEFEPLTQADKALISGYNKRLTAFYELHCYVVQDISEEQQISYIIGHSGGVEFSVTNGMSSAELQAYAVQALSALKEGRYKKKDGQSYLYESFRQDVKKGVEENLKRGWVNKTGDLRGYSIAARA